MSATPPIQYSGPTISPEVPWETRRHLQLIYQKLGNHTQAFGLLQKAVNSAASSTTTSTGVSGGQSSTTSDAITSAVNLAVAQALQTIPAGVSVNDQTGNTSYTTLTGDADALIVFSSASAMAVSLPNEQPPWGTFISNNGAPGAGTVTVTPANGTISYAGNPGAASLPIAPGEGALVAFDGTNWQALLVGSSGGGGGVTSLDGITGAVSLVAGSGITITDNSPAAGDITIAATGGGSGVVSLQGETGAITLTSAGATVVITTPTSSTINLESTGGGLPVNNPTFTGILTGPTAAINHLEASGPTPSVTLHSASGSGATSSIFGTDTAGRIVIVAGTGATTGNIATVFLAVTFTTNTFVLINGYDAAAFTLFDFVATGFGGNSWLITAGAAMTAGRSYAINYVVFGN